MICKKCGATIEETSKFCGYCGEKVNNENQTQIPVQNIEQPVANDVVGNASNQVSSNNLESKTSKTKNTKILLIVLGVVLAILATVLVILAFNKTTNSSISVLEKALANLENRGINSGTINAKINIEDNTSNSINMSAVTKYTKTNDVYDFELTLNESMFFDKMSLYLRVTEDNVAFYTDSNTIDLLGFTKSDVNTWVYYLIDLNEISEDIDISKDETIDLKSVLDEKHFKYIDKTNNINHYKLIIDKELVEKIESKMPNTDETDFNSMFNLNDSYELDFYINDSDELVRISMDLTDTIGSNEVKNAMISFEFSNFGNTNVVIPDEALNSKISIETYMNTNSIDFPIDDIESNDNDFDVNNDDFNLDLNMDMNL